jgi:cytochrome P450
VHGDFRPGRRLLRSGTVTVAEEIQLLLSPRGRADPYPIYARLREHGPIVRVQDGLYVVVGFDAVDRLLRDSRLLVQDRDRADRVMPGRVRGPALVAIEQSMVKTNPPGHHRMRRLAAVAFTARRVAALEDTVATHATALAGYLGHLGRSGDPVDFMAEFARPLPARVVSTVLGVPAIDQEWFRERAEAITAIVELQLQAPDTHAADRAATELRSYFADLVRQRRAAPKDDLTTTLVQAYDADAGTDRAAGVDGTEAFDELIGNLILLLVAGLETTSGLLGNGLAILLRHPEAAARLRADPGLAGAYLQEILRLDSPTQLTSRWTPEGGTFDGVRIEPDTTLLLFMGAGNRDPQRFAEPDRFDPSRPDNQTLSFGAGPHYCLGAGLGRMVARIALPLVLERFPGLAPAGAPVRHDQLAFRRFASLALALSPQSARPGDGAAEPVRPG